MKQDILKNNSEFLRFRNSLLAYGRKFRISFEDTEEIANDSILKALEDFIVDKGSFEAYSKIIFKNKLLNFQKRLRSKYLFLIIEDDDVFTGDDGLYYEKYENTMVSLKFLDILSGSLSEPELKFFNKFKVVCEQSDTKFIAETSKALGIENNKGWDVFRKIQRKAKNLWEQYSEEFDDIVSFQKIEINKPVVSDKTDSEFISYLRAPRIPEDIQFREFLIHYESARGNFYKIFSDSELDKLISLYN